MNEFTAIFDMDGVLIDSERVYQEIERMMYRELGLSVSPKEHRRFEGTSERFMWDYFCRKYDLDRPARDLVREERKRFIDRLENPPSIPLMDGLLPLLDSLRERRIPCWIASSSSREIILRVLQVKNLEKYFNGFVSGDEVSQSKPDPEIFLETARLAGADPGKCVVIEDSLNGIRAARAAGMSVLALRPEGYGKEEKPGGLPKGDPGGEPVKRQDHLRGQPARMPGNTRIIESLIEVDPEFLRKTIVGNLKG